MAFAGVEDVKRVLRLTDDDPTRDAQLRAALAAVESWAENRQWTFAQRGPQVKSFFDVPEDATLYIGVKDAVVTKVTVFSSPFYESARDLILGSGSPGYELLGNGALALRPSLWIQVFEGAYAARVLRTHSKVDVHYIASGVVPPAVTEGIAYLAAGYWINGPQTLIGLTSEKIGDYSYSTGSGSRPGSSSPAEPSYRERAMWFLADFMPTGHVSVT